MINLLMDKVGQIRIEQKNKNPKSILYLIKEEKAWNLLQGFSLVYSQREGTETRLETILLNKSSRKISLSPSLSMQKSLSELSEYRCTDQLHSYGLTNESYIS
jgi:hypothetical protein